MRIFIAGATGLAGSSLITEILSSRSNWKVRGTYFSTPPYILSPKIEYVKADLRDYQACREAAKGCDIAILAAALTGGAASGNSSSATAMTSNLVMDTNLLNALWENGIRRAVYISTASVYQEFTGEIKEEDLDLNAPPHAAYAGIGTAKRCGEQLCSCWHQQHGMELVIARSSNIYGPYASFNPKRANFIPALTRKAVDRMNPYEIWGAGDVLRDVIFSADFARGIITLLDSTHAYDVFNLGTGVPVSVKDVAQTILKCAQYTEAPIRYVGERPQTIARRILNCDKIQKETSWSPTYTLSAGIAETVSWWQANKEWWIK